MDLWIKNWSYIVIFILFVIMPCVSTLSFDFPSFNQSCSQYINMTGNGNIGPDGIQVTPVPDAAYGTYIPGAQVGRATYYESLHLYDKVSGQLADFNTHFTFIINANSSNYTNLGDGITFFLVPLDTPQDLQPFIGGGLGLANVENGNYSAQTPAERFVAVEFDTYCNLKFDPCNDRFDPPDRHPHVGIDINTVVSETVSDWPNDFSLAMTNEAWITYDSSLKKLRVEFTGYYDRTGSQTYSLESFVDLSQKLPDHVYVGFSGGTGAWVERNTITSWYFNSSVLSVWTVQAEPPITNFTSSNGTQSIASGGGKKDLNIALIVGPIVGVIALLLITSVLIFYCFKRNKYPNFSHRHGNKGESKDMEMDSLSQLEESVRPRKFTYDELIQMTDNFSEEAKLGQGGFGIVYKNLSRPNNLYVDVAIKRISRDFHLGVNEYAAEVKIISQLRHKNLVPLIGWCHDNHSKELFLVYEIMSNRSLDFHLFKGESSLSWEVRYKITKGLACALFYLHEFCERCVLHRDIKSSNIMLDSSFNAKLGDFGLARLLDHDKGWKETSCAAGTIGYMAPEYYHSGISSKESDIYSFGIVALEIACGKSSLFLGEQRESMKLVEWVWELYGEGKHLEAADPKLNGDFDAREMEILIVTGLCCAHPDYTKRPAASKALSVLDFEKELPKISSRMPVPIYRPSPLHEYSSSAGDRSSRGSQLHSRASRNTTGSSHSHVESS